MEDHNGAYGLGQADGSTDAPPAQADAETGRPEAGTGHPLAVSRPETGEPRVDVALSPLDELTELPVTEHPAVFERVHAQLSEILGELGSESLAGQAGRDGN